MLVAAHMIFRIDVATGVLSRVKTCAPKLPSNQWMRPGRLMLDWDKMSWSCPEGKRCCLWILLSFVADFLGIEPLKCPAPLCSMCVCMHGGGKNLCLHMVLFRVWKKRKEWLVVPCNCMVVILLQHLLIPVFTAVVKLQLSSSFCFRSRKLSLELNDNLC